MHSERLTEARLDDLRATQMTVGHAQVRRKRTMHLPGWSGSDADN